MSNSLSEQLLKAGLITQAQIDQADQARQQQKEKAKEARDKARDKDKAVKPARPPQARRPNPAPSVEGAPPAGKASQAPERKTTAPKPKPAAKTPQSSDLEQFYREREHLERQEKAAEEQRRREQAERKKRTREQVRALISANLQNVEDASIRYNFVVGDTVKYLYVTTEQQIALAQGTLAITFMEGKRCLIPAEVATQILELDPDKLIVINQGDGNELDIPLLAIEDTPPELPRVAMEAEANVVASEPTQPAPTSN